MEYFDVVDEDDKVVGKASRMECHNNPDLIHRSVQFFIFDKDGRIFVNKRSSTKEFFKSQHSIVFGGHVPAGETYGEAVVREAFEEAGVASKPFYMGYFKKRIPQEKENVKVYGFITDKDLTLLEDEIHSGEFMTIGEMKEKIKTETFIPETRQLLKILENHLTEKS